MLVHRRVPPPPSIMSPVLIYTPDSAEKPSQIYISPSTYKPTQKPLHVWSCISSGLITGILLVHKSGCLSYSCKGVCVHVYTDIRNEHFNTVLSTYNLGGTVAFCFLTSSRWRCQQTTPVYLRIATCTIAGLEITAGQRTMSGQK